MHVYINLGIAGAGAGHGNSYVNGCKAVEKGYASNRVGFRPTHMQQVSSWQLTCSGGGACFK